MLGAVAGDSGSGRGQARSAPGVTTFVVTVVGQGAADPRVMLRVTEADGSVRHLALETSTARWLAGKLVEKANQIEGPPS